MEIRTSPDEPWVTWTIHVLHHRDECFTFRDGDEEAFDDVLGLLDWVLSCHAELQATAPGLDSWFYLIVTRSWPSGKEITTICFDVFRDSTPDWIDEQCGKAWEMANGKGVGSWERLD